MRMPTGEAPLDAPVMPTPDAIRHAILEPIQKYVTAHSEIVTQNRCPTCSRLYPSGSLICADDGAELVTSPELQAIVRRMTNNIGIFVRKYGRISVDATRAVSIEWDEWQFDIRPWLARVYGIEVGKGGRPQTPSVNAPDPSGA